MNICRKISFIAVVIASIGLIGCGTQSTTPDCNINTGCWIDQTTGLRWQNSPPATEKSLPAAVDYCTTQTLGGKSGWRLPTVSELRSLIRGCPPTETAGSCGLTDGCLGYYSCWSSICLGCESGKDPSGCYWDSNLSGTCSLYWSSSPCIDADPGAWGVDFGEGYVVADAVEELVHHNVRCIWGNEVADGGSVDGGGDAGYDGGGDGGPPVPMDCSSDSGYCLDPATGYWWQDPAATTQMAFQDAMNYCPTLALGGRPDWRLPTISELRSLIRGCSYTQTGGSCGVTDNCPSDGKNSGCWNLSCVGCASGGGPGQNGCYWGPGTSGDSGTYWSSSYPAGYAYYGSAWIVLFNLGLVRESSKSDKNNVRCVRGP